MGESGLTLSLRLLQHDLTERVTMHTDESIIKSFGGDPLKADRELKQYQKAWRKGAMIGNLPQATLLSIAVRNLKKAKPAEFGKTPKAKAPKVKKELVTSDG